MSDLPFDAVLFDCDGVLVDSEPITNRVLAEMLGELGWKLSTEESMRTFTGKAVRDEAALIEARTGFAITPEWLAGFRDRRNIALHADLLAIPGAADAVRRVHALAGGRIACASGADLHKVEFQLVKVGLHDFFDGRVFSGHDTPRSKPFPDVYLAAAAALGADPVRCAVVEDTVTGVTAGVAAGATVFGYSPPGMAGLGHSDPDAMRAVGASVVFTDMSQVPDVLAAWRAPR